MKTTITRIGKGLLKAALFLAGFLAFCYMVGEPTEEWYQWTGRVSGTFAGAWFIIGKLLAGFVIYLCVKAYERMEPDAFKDNRKANVEPKAAEE